MVLKSTNCVKKKKKNSRALFNKCPLFAYEQNIGLILCPTLLFLFHCVPYRQSLQVHYGNKTHWKCMPGKPWQEPAPLAHTLSKLATTLTKTMRATKSTFQKRRSAFLSRKRRRWEEGESGGENYHFDDDCMQCTFDISVFNSQKNSNVKAYLHSTDEKWAIAAGRAGVFPRMLSCLSGNRCGEAFPGMAFPG